ncbi:hypothetical protein AFM16_37325 [Streptomyces antibioticus]|uniref:Uncharacterized protein n=1 Tax=Streptomyces antibioticus TaxID=1890 RepID=A0ABX3LBW9_STRAT|nr:hypothetical protein AFM16_37325 [Streptomyces antibioticus]
MGDAESVSGAQVFDQCLAAGAQAEANGARRGGRSSARSGCTAVRYGFVLEDGTLGERAHAALSRSRPTGAAVRRVSHVVPAPGVRNAVGVPRVWPPGPSGPASVT